MTRDQEIEQTCRGLAYCADVVLKNYHNGTWRELGGDDEFMRHAMINLRKAQALAVAAFNEPAVSWKADT